MAQKCSKMFQNDPEGSKMFHNVPQGFSMFQKVLSKSPIIQKVLECPRALKKWKNSQLKLPATLSFLKLFSVFLNKIRLLSF